MHFHGLFNVGIGADKEFRIRHYGYPVENQIFWEGITGGWEKYSMKVWMDLVSKSKVIFDVGANTGVYTLVAKALNPDVEVHGFEPFPAIYDKYLSNIHLKSFQLRYYQYFQRDIKISLLRSLTIPYQRCVLF